MREEGTKVVAEWPAGTRTTPLPGVDVYDTGQQRAGWATIKVTGAPAGTPIQVLYAEKRNPNGTVTNSGFTAVGQIQTDYYIAKGTGTETLHAAVHLQGLPVHPGELAVATRPRRRPGSGTPQPLPAGVSVTVDSVQEVRQALRPTGVFSRERAAARTASTRTCSRRSTRTTSRRSSPTRRSTRRTRGRATRR